MKAKRERLLCLVLVLSGILWHTVSAQLEPLNRRLQEQALQSGATAVWQYANRPVYPAGKQIIAPDNEGRLAFDPVLAARLQRTIDSLCGTGNAKGVSAAFLIPGQGLWQGVSGISSRSPLDSIRPDMLFGIASNTKAFTSTILLTLADEGKLSLDDSLGKWLPPYPYIDGSVTIRQLLNMTSGIFDIFDDPPYALEDSIFSNPSRPWSPEEMITTFVGPPHGPPGSPWKYCNTNYILLGMVIKHITDSSYSSELRRRILNPLALDRTYMDIEESYPGPLAHPWHQGNDISSMSRTAMYSLAWTAGAIVSTAENMARWSKSLYEGALISRASLDEMLTFVPMGTYAHTPTPGLTEFAYGLGVTDASLYGKRLWEHSGGIWGYVSDVGYFPQTGVSVAVLLNATEENPYKYLAALLHTYLKSLPAALAEPGVLYALTGSLDSARVYTADTLNASLHRVGPYRYGDIRCARIDRGTGRIWGVANARGWELVQIDGASGEAFPRATLQFPVAPGALEGMDFSPDRRLYIGTSSGSIYVADTSTGVCTLVSSPKIPISGIAFDPVAGELWASVLANTTLKDRIYKVNLHTGDTVGVGNTGFTVPLVDIAFDGLGHLFGVTKTGTGMATNRLVRIDTATGTGSVIGDFGLAGMQAIAFAPDLVPHASRVLAGLPEGFTLQQNYPNPFNPVTSIAYTVGGVGLQASGIRDVRLVVYDLLGREVAVLVDEKKAPGTYNVQFNGTGLSSGVYIYRLTAGPNIQSRKMVLMK
jgi:D-alanyl-D-alanine carboxypeptidase